MSDIIRKLSGLEPNPELFGKTTKQLAALCHEAEGTDNDVLFLDVQAEIERRERLGLSSMRLFMDWYWILWAERNQTKGEQGANARD